MIVELGDAGEQQGVTPAGDDGIGTAGEVPLFGRKKRLKGRPKRCGGAAAAAAWGSAGRWARQSRLAAAFRPIRGATTEDKVRSTE